MTTIPAGAEPLVPMPGKTPAEIRAAVARLDQAALSRFEAEWAQAVNRARDEYSVLPVLHFTEKWHLWAAVRRRPDLAARLRAAEARSARASTLAEARAASAEVHEILEAASPQAS